MDIIKSSRFKDAPWFPKEETHILIGGAGGIGSWLTLLLARAGFLPVVYDFDHLEEHNLGGQLFSKEHISMPKVAALGRVVKDFADTDMLPMMQRYNTSSMHHPYTFSAFDNMQARKDMFERWKIEQAEPWLKSEDKEKYEVEPIFIDGRLTMEQLQIFCVTPSNMDRYNEHLFDDSEVPDAPCTMKQTSHSAAMIASHMTGFFTNHYANNQIGDKDRALPFKWEYFIPIDYISVI